MMKRILFFDNSPDLWASLRLFLNVPVFLALAALLLAATGPEALASRWSPTVLALTHLMTLGVMASAMIGALLQILPVTTSMQVACPRLTGRVVHLSLSLGTLALAAAFSGHHPLAARTGFILLTLAFAWAIGSIVIGLWRHWPQRTQGSEALLSHAQLALLSLLLTILMGLAMLSVRAWGSRLGIPALTDLHGAWGLLGWLGLLLAGVTFKVIPVFQATELYPRRLMQNLGTSVFSLLAIWTVARLLNQGWSGLVADLAAVLLGMAWSAYALASLRLLRGRKRPGPDTTTRFWYVAMASFLLCLPAWLWYRATLNPQLAVLLGVLPIVGVALSAINGMLYKILPVLLWNHTQKPLASPMAEVPKLKDFLPDAMGTGQFYVHLSGLLALLGACLWPALLTLPAGLLFLVSALWLAYNMAYALLTYRRGLRNIALALEAQAAGQAEKPLDQP